MKKFSPLLYFLFFGCINPTFGQKNPDSLLYKDYDALRESIYAIGNDSVRAWPYLNAYLVKARIDNNFEKLSEAYENMAYQSRIHDMIYADSTVFYAEKTNNKKILGNAYLAKGIILYGRSKYKESLDYYLLADEYLQDTKEVYLKFNVKFGIANIKYYLGYYDEALVLYKQCADFYKENEPKGYLTALYSISRCYNKLDKYDLCALTNQEALKAAELIEDKDAISYIYHSQGINTYHKKQYNEAIKNTNLALPGIIKNNDFVNESVAYYYLGKCYSALNDKEKAIVYYKKVDKIFKDKEYVKTEIRPAYEELINYYKDKGDLKIQLHYINQLIKVDSLINKNFVYLSDKIHKEYDTKLLLSEKNKVEKELESKHIITIILYCTVVLLFALILFVSFRYYKSQKKFRKRFEELMMKDNVPEEKNTVMSIKPEVADTTDVAETKKPDINEEVIQSILAQLEKFEAKNKFLQKDLTLINLASKFNTNSNYLSKVINYYKDKSYINYINELRINYIVNLLKEDAKYRNYTIKALSEEAGFNTSQHFSKAFYAKTGIYPSYFVTEINKK